MKPPLKSYAPDDFQTPTIAIYPLLPFIPKKWIVWECAQGKGYLTRGFQENGFNVIGTDVLTGQSFLTWQPEKYDCIVTNPPFSLKQDFLIRAYSLGKPFAFLLPLTTLETTTRQKLFQNYGIEIVIFDKRLNFYTPDGNPSSKSWFSTAWCTHGFNIGKELNFVRLGIQYEMELSDGH